MATTIAHEINNPLEAIANLLYLLRSKLTDDEAAKPLASAEEELERVAHIARQTLGYYRENAAATAVSLVKLRGMRSPSISRDVPPPGSI